MARPCVCVPLQAFAAVKPCPSSLSFINTLGWHWRYKLPHTWVWYIAWLQLACGGPGPANSSPGPATMPRQRDMLAPLIAALVASSRGRKRSRSSTTSSSSSSSSGKKDRRRRRSRRHGSEGQGSQRSDRQHGSDRQKSSDKRRSSSRGQGCRWHPPGSGH